MVPADFSGAVFTCAFFQKMLFLLYKLRNAFLVTNDLSGAGLVHADFCQTLKNAQAKDHLVSFIMRHPVLSVTRILPLKFGFS